MSDDRIVEVAEQLAIGVGGMVASAMIGSGGDVTKALASLGKLSDEYAEQRGMAEQAIIKAANGIATRMADIPLSEDFDEYEPRD